jgi:NitT/TauT family transport system permease protein
MARRTSLIAAMRRRPLVSQLAMVLLFLMLWEIAARFFVDKMFLSPPSRVYGEIGRVFATKGMNEALFVTLYELAVVFAIAVSIGMTIGLMIGLSGFARRSFMPIVLLAYGTPQITILPLFILYFGIGPPSKIAFGVTHGIFPIMLAIVAGVQNLKPVLLISARSMGAGRWHILRYVVLPHMVPSFFRHASGDDGRATRRAVGRALRFDGGHRPFHVDVHAELRPDAAPWPHLSTRPWRSCSTSS